MQWYALNLPSGVDADHLAVAAYIELLPELEKSANKEISSPFSNMNKVREIEIINAEVVDSNE